MYLQFWFNIPDLDIGTYLSILGVLGSNPVQLTYFVDISLYVQLSKATHRTRPIRPLTKYSYLNKP